MGNCLHKPIRKFDESKPSAAAASVNTKSWNLPIPFKKEDSENEFEKFIKDMDLGKEWTKKYYAYFEINKDEANKDPPPIPPVSPSKDLIKRRGKDLKQSAKEKEQMMLQIEAAKRALTHTWRTYWFLSQVRRVQGEKINRIYSDSDD
jgi:hypothetical protein